MKDSDTDPFGIDDDSPRRQLETLLETAREGVVDGVTFKLDDPTIPPDLWSAPDAAYAVNFLFPSERDGPTAAELEGLQVEPSDDGWSTSFDTSANDDSSPWVQAEVGDTISIVGIRRFDRGGGPLSDVHDTEERWVRLVLTRRTGERLALEGEISFVPRDALGPHSPHIPKFDDDYEDFTTHHRITFKKIGLRLRRLTSNTERRVLVNLAVINGMRVRVPDQMLKMLPPGTEVKREWRTERPMGAERDWLLLAEEAFALATDEAAGAGEVSNLEVLLDATAAAAYALAQAECELRVSPLAINALKSVAGGGVGGRESAKSRRAKREEEERIWEPEALALAQRRRERMPSENQKNLAADVLASWRIEGRPPSFDWVLTYIRKAEAAGLLTRMIPASALPRRKR